jgi:hypothetical protein
MTNMPLFFFNLDDNLESETSVEFAGTSEAVSNALNAMSRLVSDRLSQPGDIAITISNAERSRIAVIAVTFFSEHDQTQPN